MTVMSEYLQEALWRENYRDLSSGVRMIQEAAEQSFDSVAPLTSPKHRQLPLQDCQQIAEAISTFAAKMRCRVMKLEKLLKEHGLSEPE
jgi:hypothetical protein